MFKYNNVDTYIQQQVIIISISSMPTFQSLSHDSYGNWKVANSLY